MLIGRSQAARQGAEALEIIARGNYISPSGKTIALQATPERTVEYPPDFVFDLGDLPARVETRITVENTTSLSAARALAQRGIEPLVLNFASAKHPGGGFRSGARAQEESLARSSLLYAAIEHCAMYEHHRNRHDPLYTSWMVYSPSVVVFRDDQSGALLDDPYRVGFLTGPAPNAKVVLQRRPDRAREVRDAMEERVDKALAIAAVQKHRELVLGAWGCGVFGNDPGFVAECFAHALRGRFRGVFSEVVFAITDSWDDRRTIGPFERAFNVKSG